MSDLVLRQDMGNGLCALTLNRPEKLNAFSRELMDQFVAALDALSDDCESLRVRVVLIRSATPKAFCVGADLGERLQMNEEQVSDTLAKQREIMDGVAALSAPTVAVIEGAAFGGGLELALACDLRVATESAQMGLTETRLAIIPGSGGTQRLTRLLGAARAKELIFRARRMSGAEAATLGLVNACAADPWALAQEWAHDMLAAGPLALVQAKRAIDGGQELPLSPALDFERQCYDRVLRSRDRAEGLEAFTQKRAPRYTGQ